MAQRCLGWGSNICLNLNQGADAPVIISSPAVLEGVTDVLWHSWTCSVLTGIDSTMLVWGKGTLPNNIKIRQILGVDAPVAILSDDGRVYALDGARSSDLWESVTIGEKFVHAYSRRAGLRRYTKLSDMMSNTEATHITHPMITRAVSVELYGTEDRSIALIDKRHLFEVDSAGSPNIVEGLEGLGICQVVRGPANRYAVVTQGGDVYISEARSRSFCPLELPSEDSSARLVALGSTFIILVDEEGVWSKGNNDFSQTGHDNDEWEKTEIPAADVVGVHCARWSTIVSLCQ